MIPKSFLIAGGAGFIGSHLVKKLLSYPQVEEVVVIDNFSTGCLKNLIDIKNNSHLKIIQCDITKKLPELSNYDVVLHLASIANPTQYENEPINTLLVNSNGNNNLLQIAQESKSLYIYFSSSEVYGNHNHIPSEGLKEEAESHFTLNQKRSPYFIGKSFGEELVKHVCKSYDLDFLIVRPFNIYGPNMDRKTQYGRVIPNFITWSMRKQPLLIHGDGLQERSFCYIEDFVNALISLLKLRTSTEGVVNIGNPEPISILKLANLINGIQDNPSGYIFTDKYKYEPKFRNPNIDKISNWTGWIPKIKLKEGIIKTMEAFMEEKEYGEIEQLQGIDSGAHIFST